MHKSFPMRIAIIVALTIVFSAVISSAALVFAQENTDISEEMQGAISTNCSTIKLSLKNLQRSDSNSRVYLGTNYQRILNNYIKPLNIRLAKNNTPDPKLSKIQTDFTSEKTDFTNEFIDYSRSLEELVAIDCKTKPDEFYRQLEKVRKDRKKVENAVNAANSQINAHIAEVQAYKATLLKEDK